MNIQANNVTDVENEESANSFPPTFLVLRFAPGIHPEALKWLFKRITGPRSQGGGELLIRRQPGATPLEGYMLHVSATPEKLAQAAKELSLRRPDQREPLSPSERRYIVQHEILQVIRASPQDVHIPGYPKAMLYHGQSIVEAYHQEGLLLNLYPLHDKKDLRRLRESWYCTFLRHQPVEEIRAYFGEAIALYFSFLGFYTAALVVPTLLGLLQLWLVEPGDALLPAACSLVNSLWVIIFLVLWKRRSNDLAYSWGTIKMSGLYSEPRASFRGEVGVDRVTGRVEPQYPRWKTFVKMYLVSWPIALACASIAFYVMLASFWLERIIFIWGTTQADGSQTEPDAFITALSLMPSIVYTGLVWLMNVYYRRLATWLSEWENHRTQAQFDRHRVLKLVVFEFVNNFVALFYIAFIYQDMEMLAYQIAIMMILLQTFNHFQEAIIPYLLMKYMRKVRRSVQQQKNKKQKARKLADQNGNSSDDEAKAVVVGVRRRVRRQGSVAALLQKYDDTIEATSGLDVPELLPDDPRVTQAIDDSEREEYESTYDDFLEMYIQFGYVILFSSIYPAAGVCAIVHNLLEIRADAFKLCRIVQRPLVKRVKDIGAWQRAFEAIALISVVTNCALLYLMPHMHVGLAPGISELHWTYLIGLCEHTLLAIGLIVYISVPAQTERVRVELATEQYRAQLVAGASKREATSGYPYDGLACHGN